MTGFQTTSRVKTRGTTIDKLRRNGGSWLGAIQDLAGMRIVAPGGRTTQDELVKLLVEEFGGEPKPPKVIDRRERPSSGYRAVHVVLWPDGIQVEVQIRTEWQHEWAELYEKLADRVGRGIRYGESPNVAHVRVTNEQDSLRLRELSSAAEAVVDHAGSISGLLDAYERLEQRGGLEPELRGEMDEALASMRRHARWLEGVLPSRAPGQPM